MNVRGISLEGKFNIHEILVITILLDGLESWTSTRNINQLDVFHKRYFSTIYGYTLEDKISYINLFSKCKIGGRKPFLMQFQLRWASHIVRMSDEGTGNPHVQLNAGRFSECGQTPVDV